MVSGSDSPRLSPTGTKSAPTCASIANSAGSAYCGGMFPRANCAPKRVPTTCAITAPGPKIGDKNGRAHTKEIPSIPGKVLHNGEIVFAMTFPNPLALMIPKRVLVNAMNGSTFLMIISMVSRPAWKNLLTTFPTPFPILTMIPSFLPLFAAAISSFA